MAKTYEDPADAALRQARIARHQARQAQEDRRAELYAAKLATRKAR